MRILVVQESDWLKKGPHQSHHLIERLTRMGHEVRVIDFEINWRDTDAHRILSPRALYQVRGKVLPETTVAVIRPAFLRIPIADYLSMAITHRIEIKRQMRDLKPDIVICFGILNSWMAMIIAQHRGTPTMYYVIDELHRLVPERALQSFSKLLESYNARNANRVVAINETLKQYTIRMGASQESTEVVEAGIDTSLYRENLDGRRRLRNRFGVGNDETLLMFVGWVYRFSGLKELILELSTRKWGGVKLCVVGRGDGWNELLQTRNENGLQDCVFLEDWKPFSEIPLYLQAADYAILPALRDEIMLNIVPIKIYEYLASGRPVIATRLPGIMKEFGEGGGILFVEGPQSIPMTALQFRDESRYRELCMKAKTSVGEKDWNNVTFKFLDVISRTISGNCQHAEIKGNEMTIDQARR